MNLRNVDGHDWGPPVGATKRDMLRIDYSTCRDCGQTATNAEIARGDLSIQPCVLEETDADKR